MNHPGLTQHPSVTHSHQLTLFFLLWKLQWFVQVTKGHRHIRRLDHIAIIC